MSYSKLHSSIVNSSLWTQPDPARILFVTLLAIADREGYIYGSRIGLARIANIKSEDIETSFSILLQPDPYSCDLIRSPENEGRRMEEISGGFRLLNYEYYRGLRDDDERREQNKQAQKRFRDKQNTSSAHISQSKPESAKVSTCQEIVSPAEADADAVITVKPKTFSNKVRGTISNASRRTAMAGGEGRHERIHEMIMAAYLDQNGIECPWNGAEGKQLKDFLGATPHWTDQQIAQCLANMYDSEGFPKSTPPRSFLPHLPKYLKGPLNQFKNTMPPIGGKNSSSKLPDAMDEHRARTERKRQQIEREKVEHPELYGEKVQ